MTTQTASKRLARHSDQIKLIPEMMRQMADHDKAIAELKGILVVGNPIENEPSLMERIRNIERKLGGAEFWLKTIAVLFVTQIVLDFVKGK